MNAVDTNVYVYTLDADEPVKQARAISLLDDLSRQPDDTVLMWQTAGEFLNQLRRWETQSRLTPAAVQAAFHRFLGAFALRMPTAAVFQISFDLRSHFSLSHWDSLLLAACKEAGVTTLFSEDLADSMNYDGVTVVNPFA
jgi:predicted nucleic acid-binding protein